ncbi:hypothetical protein HanPI659440_Chr04g0177881 [Helianthus annuus]|nr:hypothetical protein HanPI659440_Chr04g0177881 [Helianthus annuus]
MKRLFSHHPKARKFAQAQEISNRKHKNRADPTPSRHHMPHLVRHAAATQQMIRRFAILLTKNTHRIPTLTISSAQSINRSDTPHFRSPYKNITLLGGPLRPLEHKISTVVDTTTQEIFNRFHRKF